MSSYPQNDPAIPLKDQLRQSLQKPAIQCLLMFLFVFCAYLPTLWYTFVWDDFGGITANTSIREWKNIPQFFSDPYTFGHDPKRENRAEWRPLRNIYFLINYKMHGLHPAGWHLHHILLFSLVSALLLNAIHRLLRFHIKSSPDAYLPVSLQIASWLAVLAWAVHPANTEVTAWLKSGDELISCALTFIALATLFPINGSLTIKRGLIASFLIALAFMAKESIAPIPLIYFLLVLILSPGRKSPVTSRPFLFTTVMLFVVLGLYMIARTLLLGKLEQTGYLTGDFSSMMATMTTAAVRYLQLTFWPFWPTVQIGDYIGWPAAYSWTEYRVLRSIAILIGFTVVAGIASCRRPVVLAGFIFMVLAYTPVANIVPMMQIMAERFMFFPLVGVVLSVSWLFHLWLQPNPLKRLWLPAGIVAALLITTEIRMPRFIDNENFQGETAAALPTNARALFNYGMEQYRDKNTTTALEYLVKSMQIEPTTESGMAATIALLDLGRVEDAHRFLDNMTRDFPKHPRPFALKADLLRMEGSHKAAIDYYTTAIKNQDDSAGLYYYRGVELQEDGRTTEAIQDLKSAIRLDPNDTTASKLLDRLTTGSK